MDDEVTISFDDFPEDSSAVRQVRANPVEPVPKKGKITSSEKKRKGGRRRLKDPVNKEVKLPPDEVLFKKKYYSIGQVAEMLGEQTSLIRYWENEFDILKPRKNRKGDRFFSPEDVKMLYLINNLLRVRKFTMEGAKEFLKNEKAATVRFEMIETLRRLELFLLQLRNNC